MGGNPNWRDGQLYLAGFSVWGSKATEVTSLVRLRYTVGRASGWEFDYPAMERNFMTILNDLTTVHPHVRESNILTLDEVDGVTTMTILVQHNNQEERDAVLASGMESGMNVSFDRLEDLVRGGN